MNTVLIGYEFFRSTWNSFELSFCESLLEPANMKDLKLGPIKTDGFGHWLNVTSTSDTVVARVSIDSSSL